LTKILVVGRDFGAEEEKTGVPFSPHPYKLNAGRLLNFCLAQAGLSRNEIEVTNVVNKKPPGNVFGRHGPRDVDRGLGALRGLIDRLRPNLVVTLGNEASFACIDGWPSRGDSIYSAHGIEDRRGYIWQGKHGGKVLSSVHPAAALRQWIPWTTLLTKDLERAKEECEFAEIKRPIRNIQIVASKAEALESAKLLRTHNRLSFDIEITGDERLLCVGFAGARDEAVVYPAQFLEQCTSLLVQPWPRLLAANGQFDIHFLRSRCGIDVKGYHDDTQIAWHSCYPQLAGAKDDSYQYTRKSVSFLASLFTKDAWWKDYETDEMGMYELCGRDCCIEFDILEQLDLLTDRLDCRDIYNHGMALVMPCVDVQERGILVNEELRQERLKNLGVRVEEICRGLQELITPLLEEHRDHERFKLFEDVWTCPCCRNGRGKRARCWSCAGFSGNSPSKADLVNKFGPSSRSKRELEEKYFTLCEVCNGEGQRVSVGLNPNSPDQLKILLYEFLKLPPRYADRKLSSTTEKIRSLLPYA
jgi:uracil-DNA glycosylase family 4